MAEEPEALPPSFSSPRFLTAASICIRVDDPKVKAVDYEALRRSFYERFVVDGDAGAKQHSGRT
jgi:hypothetical protein